jgi:ABC-type transport system involved in cytochrome bd biosynthesis fused ATPase/permease subunit
MAQLCVSCRFAFGTGVVEYNRTIGQGKASSSAGSSRSKSAREAQLEEETRAAQEQARLAQEQARAAQEQVGQLTQYMTSYFQVIRLSHHVSLNSKYSVAILTFHPFAGNDYSTRP